MTTNSGYDFWVMSSLLQKSLRRGDVVLAARAVDEFIPKYANYVWNRLLVVSAEDCSDLVTGEVMALYMAYCKLQDGRTAKNSHKHGRPNGRIFFGKAVVILGKCKHSRDADELLLLCANRYPEEELQKALAEVMETMDEEDKHAIDVPTWVFDLHTSQGKRMGFTKEDFLHAEHEVMDGSIFKNFDHMVQSWGYLEPELDFDA